MLDNRHEFIRSHSSVSVFSKPPPNIVLLNLMRNLGHIGSGIVIPYHPRMHQHVLRSDPFLGIYFQALHDQILGHIRDSFPEFSRETKDPRLNALEQRLIGVLVKWMESAQHGIQYHPDAPIVHLEAIAPANQYFGGYVLGDPQAVVMSSSL